MNNAGFHSFISLDKLENSGLAVARAACNIDKNLPQSGLCISQFQYIYKHNIWTSVNFKKQSGKISVQASSYEE